MLAPRETLNHLKHAIAELEGKMARNEAGIARTNAGQFSIRNRFLDTFKRGVNTIDYDRRRINHIAPGPDFLDDAILYERGLRADKDVFLSIYGLRPSRANELCTRDKSDLVNLINTMAALVADPDTQVSANLQNRYTQFLGLIDENASNATALDRTSELGKAYLEWWSTYNEEVGG